MMRTEALEREVHRLTQTPALSCWGIRSTAAVRETGALTEP
jgi:hypothetical protein